MPTKVPFWPDPWGSLTSARSPGLQYSTHPFPARDDRHDPTSRPRPALCLRRPGTDLSRPAGLGRGEVHPRRAATAFAGDLWLESRDGLAFRRHRHLSLWPGRALRRCPDADPGHPPDPARRPDPDQPGHRPEHPDARTLAPGGHLGRAQRPGHRLRGHGAGGRHRQSLVRRPPGPDDGPAGGQHRHRQPGVPAAAGPSRQSGRLADRGADRGRGQRRADPAGGLAAARTAGGRRPAAPWRPGGLPGASGLRTGQSVSHDPRHPGHGQSAARFLAAVPDFLRLRLHHQWPDRHPLHRHGPRPRAVPGAGRRHPRADGHLRPGRHHRLRLADRQIRSAPAAVRLLQPARPLADLPAVLRFRP